MADAITGLTEVSATVEEIVSAQVQEVLTASAVVPGTIMDFSSSVGKGMDKLKIPRFGNFTVDTKAENVAVDAQVNAFSTDDLDLDQHKVIQFLIEDIADLQSKVAIQTEYVNQAGKDLAAELDQFLIDGIESGTSTAAPDHTIAYDNATDLQKTDILEARRLLNAQNVPQSDRTLLVNPDSEKSLMGISEFTRVDESGGSAALRNGMIGKLFGFDVIMSSQAEALKTLAYHRTAHAVARQMAIKTERDRDLPNLSDRWSLSHLYGDASLDSGKRQVLLGTA